MNTIDLITPEPSKRKPEWLKVCLPSGASYEHVLSEVRRLDLHTVCQEARHLKVEEFVTPATFARLKAAGDAKGFVQVVSSPLSRSSYHAEQAFT